jgi:hypothetical protein
MTGSDKVKFTVISLLMILQVFYTLSLTRPAHFTVDEGVYHMMARSMARDGSLAVWNGYAETPSEELVYSLLRKDLRDPAAPRLVPQYPSVYAFIAAPFYLIGGINGLFWVNLLAFFGTVWATGSIARRLYGDHSLALNAVLILVLGTFSWEYVQGIWPHSLSMFLLATAVLAGLVALDKESPGKAAAWAALAGLIVGIGAGIRYDAILVAPAIALPFLFASPPRIRPIAGLIAGLVPGLLLLALTNEAKFGIFSPFTYGADGQGGATSMSGYIPVMAAGVAGVVLAWLATRARVRKYYEGKTPWIVAAGIVAIIAILLVPQIRGLSLRLIEGAWELVVDLRFRPDIEEWGVTRTPTGGLAYGESLKKALLQSSPWLVLLGIPIVGWLRRRDPKTALLFLVIGAFLTLYGYQRWHGGLGFNMRYFLPFLPLAAILAADGWRNLASEIPANWRRAAVIAGLLTVFIWIPLISSDFTLAVEPVLLNTPLAIAAALGLVLVLRVIPMGRAMGRIRPVAGGVGLTLSAAALAWAFSTSFTYDLLRSTVTRVGNYQIGIEIRPLIEPDAILFSRYANRVSMLIDDDIRLAFPRNDKFGDFRRLLDIHMERDRPVYLAFNEEFWEQVAAEKLLAGLETEELYENGDLRLVRVRRP